MSGFGKRKLSARPWPWQEATQHWIGNGNVSGGSSRAAGALAAQVAVADAASGRHVAWLVMHTHEHGRVKRKVMPQAHVYNTDT